MYSLGYETVVHDKTTDQPQVTDKLISYTVLTITPLHERGEVNVVFIRLLDLQLFLQSVSSNPAQAGSTQYNIIL